jgi:quinol-cytochrome oxidoreductase complex cytochrome b subunit
MSSPSGETRSDAEVVFAESRWPIGLAIAAFIAISIALRIAEPDRESLGPPWLVPSIELAMLVALLAADPARVTRRHRWLRRLSIALIVSLVVIAAISTGILIADLINGGKVTEEAGSLLASGAVIWLGNVLVFALLYWQFDSGGPLARYRRERDYPDLAFSQQMSPELAPPRWRPGFIDYLILGLTTSTAFSPTDVMPMAPWAKLAMALQSLISLLVVGLVIARAVNVFT